MFMCLVHFVSLVNIYCKNATYEQMKDIRNPNLLYSTTLKTYEYYDCLINQLLIKIVKNVFIENL